MKSQIEKMQFFWLFISIQLTPTGKMAKCHFSYKEAIPTCIEKSQNPADSKNQPTFLHLPVHVAVAPTTLSIIPTKTKQEQEERIVRSLQFLKPKP
jgi:hypothetical protein